MNHCVVQYKKMLMKHLTCGRTARKRLICQFDGILAEFLEDHISPDMNDLNLAFGTPEEMARILLSEISEQDRIQYRKGLLVRRVLIGTLLAAFLILTTYIYFYKEKPINVTDEILPGGTQHVVSGTSEHSE